MTDVLVLSNEYDFSLDRVVHWLQQNEPGLQLKRINREHPGSSAELSATLDSSGWSVSERPTVAWLRQLLPERDLSASSLTPTEIDDILVGRRQWLAWTRLFNSLGTRWLNDPVRVQLAESKLCQLAVASRMRFNVPKTLLTCDVDKAETLRLEIGPCIVKSIATAFWEFSDQSFVFTTNADDALVLAAESWHAQPVFVQERIDGSHDARLLVIGDNAIGAQRPRSSLDWRTDHGAVWTSWSPNDDTVQKAIDFARAFDLEYGAFDFILGSPTHAGPVFLECNPSGEFGFLDDVLGGQPTRMIGQLLAKLASDGA